MRKLLFLTVACSSDVVITEQDVASDEAAYALESPTGSTIDTAAGGDRLLLCGRANVAALNARLAADVRQLFTPGGMPVNQRFDASMPSDWGDPYWGVAQDQSYVCLVINHYDDSTWDVGPVVRTGAFDLFEIQIQGFRLDASGQRVDINQDGLIDSWDWVALAYTDLLSSDDSYDAGLLAYAYRTLFGARAQRGHVTMLGSDGEGYPRAASVELGNGGDVVRFQVGAANVNECNASNPVWEECWYWEHYTGDSWFSYPASGYANARFTFEHQDNKWLAFDAETDVFDVGNARLRNFLNTIAFEPTFWVMARDSSFDFAHEFR